MKNGNGNARQKAPKPRRGCGWMKIRWQVRCQVFIQTVPQKAWNSYNGFSIFVWPQRAASLHSTDDVTCHCRGQIQLGVRHPSHEVNVLLQSLSG
ncbi:hypothetical protein [Mesorhizobium escarrei]|uniref:hypothetical protein n=1 Tax=Mesorhizobium escarrei TaxID=666018 RepID=UPI0020A741EB|nr:hypothetical protein [Mesorhizobium escarrei]